MNEDTVCTLVPYFNINEGKLEDFRKGVAAFVEKTRSEPGCVHYSFSFNNYSAHCREGYDDADALLVHLTNVGALLQEALTIADLVKLEVHGPAAEIDKLRGPMAALNPVFYELAPGGIRR